MSMKWMRGLDHNLQHDTSERERISYCRHCDSYTEHISDCGCILMSTGCHSTCWNTLYMYEERPVISMKWVECSNHSLPLDPSEKPSEYPTTTDTVRLSIYQVGRATSWSLAAVEGAKMLYTCMNRSAMSMRKWVGLGFLNHSMVYSMKQVKNQVNLLLLPPVTVRPSKISVGLYPYDRQPK